MDIKLAEFSVSQPRISAKLSHALACTQLGLGGRSDAILLRHDLVLRHRRRLTINLTALHDREYRILINRLRRVWYLDETDQRAPEIPLPVVQHVEAAQRSLFFDGFEVRYCK